MTQDNSELQLIDLLEVFRNEDDAEDPQITFGTFEELYPNHDITLKDVRVSVGSHIDRNLNSREYIQPWKLSNDGLLQFDIS